jgi:hypothetical protein
MFITFTITSESTLKLRQILQIFCAFRTMEIQGYFYLIYSLFFHIERNVNAVKSDKTPQFPLSLQTTESA